MMNEEKKSYNFHQKGSEFRTAVKTKYAYVKNGSDSEIPDEDVFSRFRRIDRVFVSKYGCVRCPHRGTSVCPYGVGSRRTVPRSHILTPWEKVVSELPQTNEKIIDVDEHREGICPERVREMAFFTQKVTNMNGLLAERADNMRDMRDLKEKIQRVVSAMEAEPATFKTVEGDVKVKSFLQQYQDTLTKYNQFLDNAVNQQLKFEELKTREREGPRTIDVQAVESHIKKTLNAKPLVDVKHEEVESEAKESVVEDKRQEDS
jgi:hypothetical protein